jgi:hypothetical protein
MTATGFRAFFMPIRQFDGIIIIINELIALNFLICRFISSKSAPDLAILTYYGAQLTRTKAVNKIAILM